MKIYPVILCGGSGTRLWPLSRTSFPKQFISLAGSRSMLQATAERAAALSESHSDFYISAPLVIANEEHRFLVRQQLQEIGVVPDMTYLEPIGRNTAPAIALASLHLANSTSLNSDALLLVLPADHVIANQEKFNEAVAIAAKAALEGELVTFGIKPSAPETGYGYIKSGVALEKVPGAYAVESFVEKPDLIAAQSFLDDGGYCWNSGMFIFKAGRYLEELREYRPDIFQTAVAAWQARTQDTDFCRPDAKIFSSCSSESIDYAVMQSTKRAALVPVEMGWSDVGSWNSLWHISNKDDNGNVFKGDVFTHCCSNNYVHAESRLVAMVGLDNVVVVETPDTVLVMHKDKAQDIKKVVDHFARQNRKEHMEHRRVHRPWGWYEAIDSGERFQVKRIVVEPGGKLSLQMHHHRAEHWVVVSGTAKVTISEKETLLTENQSIYIPLGHTHRLENPGKLPLHLIEVQSGSYLGEDDIIRFSDNYGRK